jgi:NAD(P)-dependent dehydrogenase (short-subunit alcohol dehydrogenase family)
MQAMYLITGAGGGSGSVSRRVVQSLLDGGAQVRAMVRRADDRAEQLRAIGADVIVGDLTNAGDIVDAMDGVRRMFFNMSVSPDYLRATTEVCGVALERGHLDVIVNMSQMTVSQMTLTSTDESKQHPRPTNGLLGQPIVHIDGVTDRPRAWRACAALRYRPHIADRRG